MLATTTISIEQFAESQLEILNCVSESANNIYIVYSIDWIAWWFDLFIFLFLFSYLLLLFFFILFI